MSRILPLKRVATVRFSSVDKKTMEDELPVRLCNYTDVYYRDSITPDLPFMEATATPNELREFSLHEGDVLITKDSESPDDIGIPSYVSFSDKQVLCGYHLAQLRPMPSRLNGRFLFWWMASDTMREELSARSNGITRFGLKLESIATAPMRVPELTKQRAIADFLDRQTTRIDALIAAKRKLLLTITEWEQSKILKAIGDWREMESRSLRQFRTRVLTGPFGTLLAADEYVEGGVPLINPTHIVNGRLVPEERISVPDAVAVRLSRYRLRSGDLVMGRKGDVGRAAVVPPEADGWICGSDSIAIRTDQALLRTKYLAAVLSLSLYRQQLAAHSTGVTITNVNESALLNLRVPALGVEGQDRAIEATEQAHERSSHVGERLVDQIGLLREHRQALITAAVTGQIDISTAA